MASTQYGRTLRSHVAGVKGENGPAAIKEKPMLAGKDAKMSNRPALGDLGNLRQLGGQQHQAAAKKPGRTLSKQKATTELSKALQEKPAAEAAPEPRRTRSWGRKRDSADKDEHMDVENMYAELPVSHSEAMDIAPVIEEDATLDTPDALPAGIEDIDTEDGDNPQMASEYVNDIYAYMRQLEKTMSVRKNYMSDKKTILKPRMRNLMVDWLVDVHLQFNLLQETLYMCVGIMDRYMQEKLTELSTKEVQLVGITSMFIASKFEEMYPPDLGDFIYITDQAYTDKQILDMELDIISTLDFAISRPLPLNFLRRNSKAGLVIAETHTLAKYAMEAALVDYEMAHFSPSVLAAAALALALAVNAGKDGPSLLRTELWTPTLKYYTSYDIFDFEDCLQLLAKRLYTMAIENTSEAIREHEASKTKKRINRAVYKKYTNKKFFKIALHPSLQGTVIQDLAEGAF